MMSSITCYQRALTCETRATESAESGLRGAWLDMAVRWRRLGDDGDGRGTMARLIGARSAAA